MVSIFYYDGLFTSHHNNQLGATVANNVMVSIFYYDGLFTSHHNNQLGASEERVMVSIFYQYYCEGIITTNIHFFIDFSYMTKYMKI
jgi:hypothetical protein